MKYSEKIADKLNAVVEKNYDAVKGYQEAAALVEEKSLKDFFEKRRNERQNFATTLKTEIGKFTEVADTSTSIKGDMHRTWMNMQAIFSSNNEEVILEEVVRGEKAVIKEYDEIIAAQELPISTKELLIKQRLQIEETLQEIKNFEQVVF